MATLLHYKMNDDAATQVVVEEINPAIPGTFSINTENCAAGAGGVADSSMLDFEITTLDTNRNNAVGLVGFSMPASFSIWFIVGSLPIESYRSIDLFSYDDGNKSVHIPLIYLGAEEEPFPRPASMAINAQFISYSPDCYTEVFHSMDQITDYGLHHLVVSATSNSIDIYLDNVLISTGQASVRFGGATQLAGNTGTWKIGVPQAGVEDYKLNCVLEDPRIFDHALTAEEVTFLWNGGAGTEAELGGGGGGGTHEATTEVTLGVECIIHVSKMIEIVENTALWAFEYNADALPAGPDWTVDNESGTFTEEINPAGIMHFNVAPNTDGQKVYIKSDSLITSEDGIIAEFRARGLSLDTNEFANAYVMFAADTQDSGGYLQIYADGVFIGTSEGCEFITTVDTSIFHTYRIVVAGTDITFYVDGVLVGSYQGLGVTLYAQSVTYANYGYNPSPELDTEVDFIRYSYGTEIPLGQSSFGPISLGASVEVVKVKELAAAINTESVVNKFIKKDKSTTKVASTVVVHETKSNGGYSQGIPLNYSDTFEITEENRLLVVLFTSMGNIPSNVTYDGIPMTMVAFYDFFGRFTQAWILANPPVGTHTMQTDAWYGQAEWTCTMMSLSGVNLANPVGNTSYDSGYFYNTHTLAITTTSSGGLLIDTVFARPTITPGSPGVYTPSSPQTEVYNLPSSGGTSYKNYIGLGTTATMGWDNFIEAQAVHQMIEIIGDEAVVPISTSLLLDKNTSVEKLPMLLSLSLSTSYQRLFSRALESAFNVSVVIGRLINKYINSTTVNIGTPQPNKLTELVFNLDLGVASNKQNNVATLKSVGLLLSGILDSSYKKVTMIIATTLILAIHKMSLRARELSVAVNTSVSLVKSIGKFFEVLMTLSRSTFSGVSVLLEAGFSVVITTFQKQFFRMFAIPLVIFTEPISKSFKRALAAIASFQLSAQKGKVIWIVKDITVTLSGLFRKNFVITRVLGAVVHLSNFEKKTIQGLITVAMAITAHKQRDWALEFTVAALSITPAQTKLTRKVNQVYVAAMAQIIKLVSKYSTTGKIYYLPITITIGVGIGIMNAYKIYAKVSKESRISSIK